MASVLVFCGSALGEDPAFAESARELGRALADDGHRLVYGGAAEGLMGQVADAALARGGEVTGIMPKSLSDRERAHRGLHQLEIVGSLAARKERMFALADAVVALPGGFGTLDELFEALTYRQLGEIATPIGLVNLLGYWDGLLAWVERSVAQGFVRSNSAAHLLVRPTVSETLRGLKLVEAASRPASSVG